MTISYFVAYQLFADENPIKISFMHIVISCMYSCISNKNIFSIYNKFKLNRE